MLLLFSMPLKITYFALLLKGMVAVTTVATYANLQEMFALKCNVSINAAKT